MNPFIIELGQVIQGPMGALWIIGCSYVIVGCLDLRSRA